MPWIMIQQVYPNMPFRVQIASLMLALLIWGSVGCLLAITVDTRKRKRKSNGKKS